MGYGLKVFSGNANRPLAEKICQHLEIALGDAVVSRFPGGETKVQIGENIRGQDVYIVQPICANGKLLSPNDALMELLILVDAARRASARRITAVIPYYGYARQDRKDRPRVPITAKLVANMIMTAGARRVLTLDLHANQVQGFFDIPVDHLYAIPVFKEYLLQKQMTAPAVVAPDAGGIKMAWAYAELLGGPLAIVDKRRTGEYQPEAMQLIGEVEGKDAVIIDDIISTGGTLIEGVKVLKERGALDIYAVVVHPVLAPSAIERVEESLLTELVVSDSIPLPQSAQNSKIKVLSVAPILAEAIRRIHNDESVSTLFADTRVEG